MIKSSKLQLPSYDQLFALFYVCENSKSGLRNKITRNSRALINAEAGCKDSRGYYRVSINGSYYYVHRIIYVLKGNKDPNALEVHHKVPYSNTAELVKASRRENECAKFKTKRLTSSKFKGVCLCKNRLSKPWQAQIRVNKKLINLGRFDSEVKAALAYNEAVRLFVPEHFWSLNPVK